MQAASAAGNSWNKEEGKMNTFCTIRDRYLGNTDLQYIERAEISTIEIEP